VNTVCANRIFVQDGIYDKFASALTDAVSKFKVGEGTQEGVTHGPLVHKAAVDKVARHVESALAGGAKVAIGGKRREGEGFFYMPTVLTEVKRCEIDEEETFGPIAPLYRFKTEEEVLKLANEPEVGLAGCVSLFLISHHARLLNNMLDDRYFFSENLARISRVSSALQVGMASLSSPEDFLRPH
jgi:succinate-semialdehyde dehydrogenase/glutarate-semialdehyde dehydrogenase